MSNVLPAAFITVATYALIALCKSVVPGFARLPNNALRAVGFVLCYAMLVVNALVAGVVHWADLWGLLPVAGALFSTAALMYHIGTDGPPAPGSAPQPPPAAADPAPRAPAAAPSAPDAAWTSTRVTFGAPVEEPVGPSVAASATPPEPPEKQTPPEAPAGPSVTYSSGPPTP